MSFSNLRCSSESYTFCRSSSWSQSFGVILWWEHSCPFCSFPSHQAINFSPLSCFQEMKLWWQMIIPISQGVPQVLNWCVSGHCDVRFYSGEHPLIEEVFQKHPLGNAALFTEDRGVPYKPLVKFPEPMPSFFQRHALF